jgi:hypothetical protein
MLLHEDGGVSSRVKGGKGRYLNIVEWANLIYYVKYGPKQW